MTDELPRLIAQIDAGNTPTTKLVAAVLNVMLARLDALSARVYALEKKKDRTP